MNSNKLNKKDFLINISLLIFLNLLIKPFWVFGIDRKVQNMVGAEDYGFYFSLLSFSFLFNILLDLGITTYNNRTVAQNNENISTAFLNILSIKILLGFIYAVICFAIGYVIGYESKQFYLLSFLVVNQFLLSLIQYFRSSISGLQNFKTDSFFSVIDRVLMIAFCSVLFWGNVIDEKFRIEWFVYAQTISYTITSVLAFVVVMKYAKKYVPKITISESIHIVKQSCPYALLILLMTVYSRVDTVLLERMTLKGATDAGIYAQSYRILDAASMFAYLFAGILMPMFAKMLKQNQKIDNLLFPAFTLLIVPSLLFVLSVSFYHTEIMKLLYHNDIEESAQVFSLLIFGFLPMCITYTFGALLTANGNIKELNILAFACVILNVGLNLVLIPRFHAFGAAIANVITLWINGIYQIYLAWKLLKFRFPTLLIMKLFVFSVFTLGLLFLSSQFSIAWYLSILIVSVCSLVLVFVLKILNVNSLKLLRIS